MRNRFTNPADGSHYDWIINHDAEEGMGKARAITRTANTGNVGAVRQQGDDGPVVLSLSGTILDRSQLLAFWQWYALCKTQTIHFTDYDGQSYVVQITDFVPVRKKKLSHTGRDPSMPYHFYTYTIKMDVYAFLAGDMLTAGVTP